MAIPAHPQGYDFCFILLLLPSFQNFLNEAKKILKKKKESKKLLLLLLFLPILFKNIIKEKESKRNEEL